MKRTTAIGLLLLATTGLATAAHAACVPTGNIRCNVGLPLDLIDGAQNGIYNYGYNGAGVDIYIVDSGFSAANGQAEFGPRYKEVANFTSEPIGGNGNGSHGITMAKTAAGTSLGVANGANIRLVRVIGTGETADSLKKGLEWIRDEKIKLDQGQPTEFRRQSVVNISLTRAHDPAVNAAVAQLVANQIPVFVAAGNNGLGGGEGGNACALTPAGEPSAFTVSAGDAYGSRQGWANYGQCVDGFAWHSHGTSESTAMTSGVAALIWQQYPTLNAAGLIAELKNRAQKHTMANTPFPLNGSQNLVVTSLAPAAAPSILGVKSDRCYGSNTLQWLDSGPEIIAYEVQRSATANFAAPVAAYTGTYQSINVNVTGTTYYRVRACNSRGCSAYVNGNRAATYTPTCE
ncbi:S8 family serine peptidase [Pseudomonas sp. CGJS7]|uniref:S8 family serine peptidase n=1 Tax=Pseudomonas sp. CGJS7 TaxID=3109348 RepID=UPI00300B7FC2